MDDHPTETCGAISTSPQPKRAALFRPRPDRNVRRYFDHGHQRGHDHGHVFVFWVDSVILYDHAIVRPGSRDKYFSNFRILGFSDFRIFRFLDFRTSTGPYWTLLDPIGPYWTLLDPTGPYWTLLNPTGHYFSCPHGGRDKYFGGFLAVPMVVGENILGVFLAVPVWYRKIFWKSAKTCRSQLGTL